MLYDELEKHFHVCCTLKRCIELLISIASYNKFAQITARAMRASLKDDHRVAAERRGVTSLRYQQWENGLGGQQVWTLLTLRWLLY